MCIGGTQVKDQLEIVKRWGTKTLHMKGQQTLLCTPAKLILLKEIFHFNFEIFQILSIVRERLPVDIRGCYNVSLTLRSV